MTFGRSPSQARPARAQQVRSGELSMARSLARSLTCFRSRAEGNQFNLFGCLLPEPRARHQARLETAVAH